MITCHEANAPLILAILLLSGLACQQTGTPRTGSKTSEDWLLLFDGRSLDQWQSSTTDENVAICWQIRDGELCGIPRSQRPEGAQASLLTKRDFSNFELDFEFKLDAPTTETATNGGVEVLRLSQHRVGTGVTRSTPESVKSPVHTPPPTSMIFSPASGAELRPFGAWNNARIIANVAMCEHWLNGVRVLVYERGGETFRSAIAKSKFRDGDHFGELPAGRIMLQDHGGGVHFRCVRIRQLQE